jgi:hypothetical protein
VDSPSRIFVERLLPAALLSGGEKVPKADEGLLVLAEKWTVFIDWAGETRENTQLQRENGPLIRLRHLLPR